MEYVRESLLSKVFFSWFTSKPLWEMTKEMAKVTIYVDDDVWSNFKEQVFRKHGSLRKLSSEVESILRTAMVGDQIVSAFLSVGVTAKGTVSSQEVKAMRPKLRGPPSEEIIRGMRHKRLAQTLS